MKIRGIYNSVLPLAAAFLICTLCNCGDKSNPVGPSNTTYVGSDYRYTVRGDSLVLNVNRNVCDSLALIHVSTMTMVYVFRGDTMILSYAGMNPVGANDSAGVLVVTRLGPGTGIVGSWKLIGIKDSVNQPLDTSSWGASGMADATLEITATNFISRSPRTQAQMICTSFTSLFSPGGSFRITVSQPTITTVQVHGDVSNETITISVPLDNQSATYTSSNTLHQTYVYYQNPATCPNVAIPPWFQEFLIANVNTTLAKKSINAMSAGCIYGFCGMQKKISLFFQP
jgi:hypothetical protein